jgi:hypothetical protein
MEKHTAAPSMKFLFKSFFQNSRIIFLISITCVFGRMYALFHLFYGLKLKCPSIVRLWMLNEKIPQPEFLLFPAGAASFLMNPEKAWMFRADSHCSLDSRVGISNNRA